MSWTAKLEVWGLAALLIFVGGMGLGWKLRSPKPVKAEPPAARIIQADGSQILPRRSDAEAKPAQIIPKGAKVERLVQVVVQPNQPGPAWWRPSNSAASALADPPVKDSLTTDRPPCPPVRVDLSVVRLADATHRVLVSSPDGTIIDGVDIPVEPAAPEPKTLKWAAGAVYGTTAWGDTAKGVFIDRDFALLRTGAELTRNSYALANRQGWELRARFGIRF